MSVCDHADEREEQVLETPIEVPEISEILYSSTKPNRVFDSKPLQGMMKQLKGDSEVQRLTTVANTDVDEKDYLRLSTEPIEEVTAEDSSNLQKTVKKTFEAPKA
jgi:hypothetical protein